MYIECKKLSSRKYNQELSVMKPLELFSKKSLQNIRGVFTDIDDTLTDDGRLTANAYLAIETLDQAGIKVVPITGRPAGWCDLIARLWPVTGVVGENGAFYFQYDRINKKMHRYYADDEAERIVKREKLNAIAEDILLQVPGAAISADQFSRETDLAIDFAEGVPKLPEHDVNRIVEIFQHHHATAKVSSIHVNGWFGNYDKLTMTRIFASQCLHTPLEEYLHEYIFVGDSPNDAPMFDYFSHSIGVANLRKFTDRLSTLPTYITESPGGKGFAEVAKTLIQSCK